MNWYYVEQGQQAGPVDDAQLEQMHATGRIQDDTLLWHEGMANWQAYREVKGAATPPASAPAPAAAPAPGLRLSTAPAAEAGAAPTPDAVCSQCGNMFPKDNMLHYGTSWVCAKCKPLFMQKLAEGAQLNVDGLRYAGFWVRFGARFVDGIILGVVNFAISMVAGVGIGAMAQHAPNAAVGLQLTVFVINMGIALSYETFMIGKYGATLGKMACKIHVVTAEGGKVSYARALGRYFATLLSAFLCAIGYIIAAFDSQKRALHDHICNTRVVFN